MNYFFLDDGKKGLAPITGANGALRLTRLCVVWSLHTDELAHYKHVLGNKMLAAVVKLEEFDHVKKLTTHVVRVDPTLKGR